MKRVTRNFLFPLFQEEQYFWENGVSLFDAGTSNGLKLWKPPGDSMESYVTQEFRKSNYWQEVSVLGYIYDCDFTRSLSRRKVRNRIFVL